MKEIMCNQCGVIFEVDNGTIPEIECTCKCKEFIVLN